LNHKRAPELTLFISAKKTAKLLSQMIRKKAKKGDYYIIEVRSRWWYRESIVIYYSRYYSGGTYEHICTLTLSRENIEWYSYNRGQCNEFCDIADPTCFDQIVDKVIEIASEFGLERERGFDCRCDTNAIKIKKPSIWIKYNDEK